MVSSRIKTKEITHKYSEKSINVNATIKKFT